MSEKAENSQEKRAESYVDIADKTRVMETLFNLPFNRWAKILEQDSFYTAALAPYGVHVGFHLAQESRATKKVYEVSFYFVSNPNNKPDRKVFSDEEAEKLYAHLVEGEKEVRTCKNLEEAIASTL